MKHFFKYLSEKCVYTDMEVQFVTAHLHHSTCYQFAIGLANFGICSMILSYLKNNKQNIAI